MLIVFVNNFFGKILIFGSTSVFAVPGQEGATPSGSSRSFFLRTPGGWGPPGMGAILLDTGEKNHYCAPGWRGE